MQNWHAESDLKSLTRIKAEVPYEMMTTKFEDEMQSNFAPRMLDDSTKIRASGKF